MARTSIKIDTRQIIHDDNTLRPLVGTDALSSPYDFDPWKWDDRYWGDDRTENVNLKLEMVSDAPMYGIPDAYIQCGVGNTKTDLEVLGIVKQQQSSVPKWSARVRHGNYFRYIPKRYYFSDQSIVQFIDNADNEGSGVDTDPTRNVLTLTHRLKHGSPIHATVWYREIEYDENERFKFIKQKINFSGTYTDNVENDTRTGTLNEIDWQYADVSKDEFIVDRYQDPPKLIFNKDFTELIGKSSISSDDELEYCEYLGESDGSSGQMFLTRFFPIVDNTEITLYVDDYSTTWSRWQDIGTHVVNRLDSDTWSSQTGHKFRVNQATADSGYYSLDTNTGELTFPSTPPAAGSALYLRYRRGVMVEYEPEYSINYIDSQNINLNPVRSTTNEGFVYISEEDMRVASITLEADTTEISSNLFGPLYIGVDYTYLIATVYNRKGLPVPGITVTFSFPEYTGSEDFGMLAGRIETATSVTNADGQAKIVYTPPQSIDSIGTYIEHPITDTANQLDAPDNPLTTDIYTYKVYSGDPWLPWDSVNLTGGKKVVEYKWDDTAIHPRTGFAGAYTSVHPTSITNDYIIYADNLAYTGVTVASPDVDGGAGGTSKGVLSHAFSVNIRHVAYWITGGTDIDIKASAYSSLYRQNIDSNDISIRLDIPQYLKGTYVSESIGTVPFGFRLHDDYFNQASAINGATYLSINPAVGYWGVLWPSSTGMALTGEVETTNPFSSGRHLELEKTIALQGYRFAVNGYAQGHTFTVV